jgi:hypothetical protein
MLDSGYWIRDAGYWKNRRSIGEGGKTFRSGF